MYNVPNPLVQSSVAASLSACRSHHRRLAVTPRLIKHGVRGWDWTERGYAVWHRIWLWWNPTSQLGSVRSLSMTHFDTRYEDYVSMQDSKIKTPTSKHSFPGPTISQRESIHTNHLKSFPPKISRKPQNLIKNKERGPILKPRTLSALPQNFTTSPK